MTFYKTTLVIICLVFSACTSKEAKRPIASDRLYDQERLGEFLTASGRDQTNEYIISIGDILDVVFLYHKDLTTYSIIVRSDGRISLPYVGDVMAAGNTPMHLDSVLTNRFGEILQEPNLSVIIKKSADKVVYVLGQVKAPGGFPFEKNISLLQSIAEAGGTTDKAKSDHTLVIRREGVSKIIGVEVNVKAIMKGEAIQNDILLRNNDIVFVPKKRINSVAEFVSVVHDIIEPPYSIFLRGWDIHRTELYYELLRERVD